MPQIWTIGHWTRPESTFLELLAKNGVDTIADVRAHPGSRTSPQFGRDVMPGWLDGAEVAYLHVEQLGGRRRKQDVDPDVNAGWNNVSFKNYADYTMQPEFEAGLAQVTDIAAERHVALMCAEPMPWRCHRLLISNALTARGWSVRHILDDAEPLVHQTGQWGAAPSVDADGRLTYPV